MMYIWNGYTVIGKHKDLTEGMLKTLDEAQKKLDSCPSMQNVFTKTEKETVIKPKELQTMHRLRQGM